MENLKLNGFCEIVDSSLSTGLSCFTIDSFHNIIYAITKSNQIVSIDQKSKLVKILTEIDNERVTDSFALNVELFVENDVLNIYFDNGSILTYSLESSEINCVGLIEEGIAAVSSSPDQESIAIISKKDKLFLFSRFFDVLVEKDIHTDHSECIKKVDAGWGSKSTQFHGSEGKEASKKTEPLEPPVAWDDQKKRICWRGDGLYFVTSAINPEKNHRVLRVWSNEGLLQYESEYVAGLEHSLAWRPEGNLIASSRFYQNVHEIVFFEKNGLRHGQFSLPVPHTSFIIKHLTWSTDSSILLVHGLKDKQHIIYLYTMRNYHYYLKQCYKFDDVVELVTWDPSSQLIFTIFTSSGSIKQYTYNWATDYCNGSAAVIDGFKVQLTPFNRVNIPPPMSAYSVIFEKPINEVDLHTPQVLLSYTCDGELIVCKLTQSEDESEIKIETNVRNTAIGSISGKILNQASNLPGLYHLRLFNDSSSIAIRKNKAAKDELIQIDLISGKITQLANFDEEVSLLAYYKLMKVVALQLVDRSIKQLSIYEKKVSNWHDIPAKLINMAVVSIDDNFHLIGLSREGTLYFDAKPFMKNACSSFLIHQEKFLISTGNDNFLRCNLLDTFFLTEVLPTGLDMRDEPRNIERRSKLVITIEEDARVILQMPRGNLESTYPRVILLDLLKQLLSAKQFGTAFNMMRRHRINLNLLVDHEFERFPKTVGTLIDQIGSDVQNICLFLSELSAEHITRTMYKFAYLEETLDSENKLHNVCSQMRDVMQKKDPEYYLIPILVTYVKDDPPKIDKALEIIFDLGKGKVQDDALRYLNYLIDIEKLYKEALGTYNFDIFLMVAGKSNKDPKEYHAYLNKLRDYKDRYYRQYKIDVDLKRYEKALTNMAKLYDEDYREECLSFIKNNRLFWSAVKVLPEDHPWKITIWEIFGDYLLIKRYYEEAGIAYQKAKSVNNAIKAYQLSENWQSAIELALTLTDYDTTSLCRSFVTRLVANGKYLDAARIQEIHLKDKNEAILTLIEGHQWAEAHRLIGIDEKDFLVEDLQNSLRIALTKEASNLRSIIREKRKDLELKVDRLKIVEQAKLKSLETEFEQFDDDDLFSDTSSISDSSSSSSVASLARSTKSKGDVVSLATRKTRHKNKKQLKRYSLKEGSANEDVALRKLIKEIIESCVALTEEAGPLIRWLFFYNKSDIASWCQTDLTKLLEYVDTQTKTVWPDPEDTIQLLNQTAVNKVAVQSLATRCLKEPDSFVPPKLNVKPWKLALIQD